MAVVRFINANWSGYFRRCTRLTGSGLSITRWDVITGVIPPLNAEEWIKAFELYEALLDAYEDLTTNI